eukprot:7380759-Prymnesium_polylepis.1
MLCWARAASAGRLLPAEAQPTYIVKAHDDVVTSEVAAVLDRVVQQVSVACTDEAAALTAHLNWSSLLGAVDASTAAIGAVSEEVQAVVLALVSQVEKDAAVDAQAASADRAHIASVAAEATAKALTRVDNAAKLVEAPVVTVEEVPKLKVPQLKEALSDRGLDTVGLKPALVERLVAALEEEQQEDFEFEDEADAAEATGAQ